MKNKIFFYMLYVSLVMILGGISGVVISRCVFHSIIGWAVSFACMLIGVYAFIFWAMRDISIVERELRQIDKEREEEKLRNIISELRCK